MGKNPLEPHKWFILGVLDKEVRLSFAKRIRDNENFPESYRHLVPTSRDNDIPEYKYSKEREYLLTFILTFDTDILWIYRNRLFHASQRASRSHQKQSRAWRTRTTHERNRDS